MKIKIDSNGSKTLRNLQTLNELVAKLASKTSSSFILTCDNSLVQLVINKGFINMNKKVPAKQIQLLIEHVEKYLVDYNLDDEQYMKIKETVVENELSKLQDIEKKEIEKNLEMSNDILNKAIESAQKQIDKSREIGIELEKKIETKDKKTIAKKDAEKYISKK